MHGLVTLLPSPFYERIEAIWDQLEQTCGLKGVRITPYPHFSWNIAEDYDFNRLKEVVTTVASNTRPFTVRTAGLGLFAGESPVVYILVVRNDTVSTLHQQLWQMVAVTNRSLSPLYAPDTWVPHISLAYEDVDSEGLQKVMDELAFETYNWEFVIDNIALIRESAGQTGELEWKIPLGG